MSNVRTQYLVVVVLLKTGQLINCSQEAYKGRLNV